MELQRRFGVIIVCGIPAIVGSGLLWAVSEKWALVLAYLFLLAFSLLVFLVAPQRITSLIQFLNPVSDRIKGLGSKLRESFSG
jgi:cell division protein FtsW (lipid II flippase)